MGAPTSVEANPQIRALLDKALASPNGLQIKMANPKTAKKARFQMYEVRDRERKQSTKFYEPGDPNYATSPWDTLSASIIEIEGSEEVWLRIMPGSISLEGLEIIDPVTGEKLD